MKGKAVNNILFIDGECMICQRSARFIAKIDYCKNIHFSSLQGKAAEILPSSWRTTEDESGVPSGQMVLIENYQQDNEKRWRGAEAAFRTLYLMGGMWRLLSRFHIIPSFITDSIYRFIARNRRRFSGGKESCKLPSKELLDRFIP